MTFDTYDIYSKYAKKWELKYCINSLGLFSKTQLKAKINILRTLVAMTFIF